MKYDPKTGQSVLDNDFTIPVDKDDPFASPKSPRDQFTKDPYEKPDIYDYIRSKLPLFKDGSNENNDQKVE